MQIDQASWGTFVENDTIEGEKMIEKISKNYHLWSNDDNIRWRRDKNEEYIQATQIQETFNSLMKKVDLSMSVLGNQTQNISHVQLGERNPKATHYSPKWNVLSKIWIKGWMC